MVQCISRVQKKLHTTSGRMKNAYYTGSGRIADAGVLGSGRTWCGRIEDYIWSGCIGSGRVGERAY